MKYILLFFHEFLNLTNEMSPYLLLGLLFAGILHVFIKKETVSKYLGKKNLKSVLIAALFGIPLPLCSCGVIPTGVAFHKEGASKGATVSFLISTPQTGIDSILVTYSLMGLPFAIFRPIIALLTGLFGGLLTNFISKEKKNTEFVSSTDNVCELKQHTKENKIIQLLKYAFIEFIDDIAKWLIIGLLIATTISIIVPDDFFSTYLKNDFLSMIVILIASIPLYVCATSSVPIALVLLLKGISPGAALVFLMAGPATNAATIAVLGKTLGKKATISYIISIIVGAMFFGLLVDNFIPREWLLDSINLNPLEHNHILPHWFGVVSSIILMSLIIFSLSKKIFNKFFNKQIKINTMNETTLTVKGMTCNHCKANVEKNLIKLEEIDEVVATPTTNSVYIKGSNLNEEKIKQIINDLGYEA